MGTRIRTARSVHRGAGPAGRFWAGLLAELRRNGWPGGLGVSQVSDLRMVAAALNAGVRGFILSTERRLVRADWTAPASGNGQLGGLSQREVEVIRHVADGRSNRDIGDAMGLSALTVKSHLARIARKLGTGDRAGMVAISLRNGIITYRVDCMRLDTAAVLKERPRRRTVEA